jgi:hypothetical protein
MRLLPQGLTLRPRDLVPEFLVELYVPRGDGVDAIDERARGAVEDLTREGVDTRYLRSILVPEDETCFLLFEADSMDTVRTAARLADIPVDRITETVTASGSRTQE